MLKSVICLTLLYLTDYVHCEPDYIFNENVNGWLKFHPVPATWHEAFLQCHYEDAILASPINSDFESALSQLMSVENPHGPHPSVIHIGSNALFSEGDYISIEGVPLADMPVKWKSYRDNESSGRCLYFYDKTISPIHCSSYYQYICYKKRNNSTTLNECGTFDDQYHFSLETGSCYKLHKEERTWNTAHKVCVAEGGYLAIINDKEEATVIKSLFQDLQEWERPYIGLRKWAEDLWLTIHGEKLENVYHEWYGQKENEVACFLSDGNIGRCRNIQSSFICEKDPYNSRFQPVLK